MKKVIRERDIEKYLVERVEMLGGKAYKLNSAGNRALPDRLCVLPQSGIVFIEVKAPGKKPTPLQRVVIKFLRSLDQTVLVIDSKALVDLFYSTTKGELEKEGLRK